MKVSQLKSLLKNQIKSCDYFIPEREVDDLIGFVLQKSWSDLILNKDLEIKIDQQQQISSLFSRLLKGQPLAYLIEKKHFYKYDFFVNPSVLIPRPETEILVEKALELMDKSPLVVLDFGSGSGCIGLTIAKERPKSLIYLIDVSKEALDVAQKNKELLGLNNVEFLQADIKVNSIAENNFGGHVDLILANPPYIDFDDPLIEKRVFDFEPHQALFAENNGLACIEAWLEVGLKLLKPQGLFLMEIGSEQREQVLGKDFLRDHFTFASHQDYSGHDRLIILKKK